LFALLAAFVIAYAGSLRFPLPQVPFFVGLACYLLAVVGLFLSGMAEEPLPVGLGLLVFLNGFDLFFGALEPSILVAGLLGTIQLLVTLAVSYLALTGRRQGRRSDAGASGDRSAVTGCSPDLLPAPLAGGLVVAGGGDLRGAGDGDAGRPSGLRVHLRGT
jgi:hypothetical protein